MLSIRPAITHDFAYLCTHALVTRELQLYRGFTTLSSTLGHLVIALHDGLLHAISSEAHMAALVNMLKTLGTLMLSAAYGRLPTDLLPRCIEVSYHFDVLVSHTGIQ